MRMRLVQSSLYAQLLLTTSHNIHTHATATGSMARRFVVDSFCGCRASPSSCTLIRRVGAVALNARSSSDHSDPARLASNALCSSLRMCATTVVRGGEAAPVDGGTTTAAKRGTKRKLRKQPRSRGGPQQRDDSEASKLEDGPVRSAEPASTNEGAAATAAEAVQNRDTHQQTKGGEDGSRRHTGGGTAPSPPPPGTAAGGWAYDYLHPSTGKTDLEQRFERSAERVQEIFDQPIPELPSDGNAKPHFLLGFAHYNHRLRDQYRLTVASMLGVHPRNVALSIGWSGRFDVSRFGNCQKVCGVAINTTTKEHDDQHSGGGDAADGSTTTTTSAASDSRSAASLSGELADAVHALVTLAQRRKDERLLGLHIINGAMPVSEIQFTERNRNVDHFIAFMKTTILSRHQVVIIHNVDAPRELEMINGRWKKLFVDRQVLPHIISTDDVMRAWARAQAGGGEGLDDGDLRTLFQAAVTKLASGGIRRFPMVFCNGVHVGSTPQMQYLTKNQQALNAILLHPNDIGFAKRFLNQLSPGGKRRETLLRDAVGMHSGRVQS